jgi:hypothetical protein
VPAGQAFGALALQFFRHFTAVGLVVLKQPNVGAQSAP